MDIPSDEIFSLLAAYKKDQRPEKINGGIGVIVHDDGRPFVFPTVAQVAKTFPVDDFSYLPISGYSDFLKQTVELCLGDNFQSETTVAQGTCGGTNALSLWAQMVKAQSDTSTVLVGTPTWNNHVPICSAQGLSVITFPWLTTDNKVNVQILRKTVQQNSGAWLLLQSNTHNPTGFGINQTEINLILEAVNANNCSLLLDIPYLGLGDNLETDRLLIQLSVKKGIPLAIAFSFSKIMSLYQHRTGALWMHDSDQAVIEVYRKLLPHLFRVTNSNPPAYGEFIASTILGSKELRSTWMTELEDLRNSIDKRRLLFCTAVDASYSYLKQGKGLYALLPLSINKITRLREEFGIYLLSSGRINFGGLSLSQITAVAAAINSMK